MSDAQRTAIVTGAAGGIGRALVQGLLGAGIRVAAVDRTAAGLAELEASARTAGRAGHDRRALFIAHPSLLPPPNKENCHCQRGEAISVELTTFPWVSVRSGGLPRFEIHAGRCAAIGPRPKSLAFNPDCRPP